MDGLSNYLPLQRELCDIYALSPIFMEGWLRYTWLSPPNKTNFTTLHFNRANWSQHQKVSKQTLCSTGEASGLFSVVRTITCLLEQFQGPSYGISVAYLVLAL